MEIRQMDREACAGKKFTARYKTSGYYDIRACDMGYQLQYVPFEAAVERSFDDVFFGEWLERQEGWGFASPLLTFSDAPLTFSENMV